MFPNVLQYFITAQSKIHQWNDWYTYTHKITEIMFWPWYENVYISNTEILKNIPSHSETLFPTLKFSTKTYLL